MEIVRVNDLDKARICDDFLTELMKFESNFDDLINNKCVVKNYFEKSLENETANLAIAIDNNKPVGYIYAFSKFKKNAALNGDVIVVDGLFVVEEYRRKGVGTKLLEFVENWAKEKFEKPYIEISYLTNNTNAENCYKKYGFKPVKEILRKKVN